jgi:type IV secretory pathway TrbD component
MWVLFGLGMWIIFLTMIRINLKRLSMDGMS